MSYLIKFRIGDWSDDGHGKFDIYEIVSNYSVDVLREAYYMSCKKTDITFHKNYLDSNSKSICVEYGDSMVSDNVVEILMSLGLPNHYLSENNEIDGTEAYTKLLLWFISLSMPEDWKWNFVEDKSVYFNGPREGELRKQFGYGLF